MKIVATLVAVFLWLLGALFLLAAAHPDAVAQGKSIPRIVVGLFLILGGGVLLYLGWKRFTSTPGAAGSSETGSGDSLQEPPGQLSLKALTCPHCGAQVDASSAEMNAEGTLVVTCKYCGGAFMVEEEPKW